MPRRFESGRQVHEAFDDFVRQGGHLRIIESSDMAGVTLAEMSPAPYAPVYVVKTETDGTIILSPAEAQVAQDQREEIVQHAMKCTLPRVLGEPHA